MKLKVGNMNLTFSNRPPITEKEEASWGLTSADGSGNLQVWLNPTTEVDDKWAETFIHELCHVVEYAYGKPVSHAIIRLLANVVMQILIQTQFLDPAKMRAHFDTLAEPGAHVWGGESRE